MTSWDEPKRRRNIERHGLDFEGAEAIWDNFTITREDTRDTYREKRMVTFGLLNGQVVVLVHVDRNDDMHVISLREAEKYEARYYFETAEEYFRKGRRRRQSSVVGGHARHTGPSPGPWAAKGSNESADHHPT